MDLSDWEWTCPCCGERKRGVPDLAYDGPIHLHWADEGNPDFVLVEKTSDTCVMRIGGAPARFIRCVLPLPVQGLAARFGFGVWSSLSEASFRRYDDSYDDPRQSRIGPMFGYLSNRLPFYPDTLNLKLDVLPQDARQRPLLRIRDEHADHPLHADQARGIAPGRLAELVAAAMPCDGRA